MTRQRLETGRFGEELVVKHLQQQGWRVIATNWRCRAGEIDIVAQEDDSLVFVEVRTRRSDSFGTPEESITPRKQARLRRLGATYVQRSSWTGPWRIDVVAVRLHSGGRAPDITHYRHAVSGGD